MEEVHAERQKYGAAGNIWFQRCSGPGLEKKILAEESCKLDGIFNTLIALNIRY